MSDDPKPWWTSTTIIASMLTPLWPSICILAHQFHLVLPDQDIVVTDLAAVATLVSAGIAIWGRIHAKAPIGKPQP